MKNVSFQYQGAMDFFRQEEIDNLKDQIRVVPTMLFTKRREPVMIFSDGLIYLLTTTRRSLPESRRRQIKSVKILIFWSSSALAAHT